MYTREEKQNIVYGGLEIKESNSEVTPFTIKVQT